MNQPSSVREDPQSVPQVLTSDRGYDLVHRSGEENEPMIVTLRDWLREEVRDFLATPEA